MLDVQLLLLLLWQPTTTTTTTTTTSTTYSSSMKLTSGVVKSVVGGGHFIQQCVDLCGRSCSHCKHSWHLYSHKHTHTHTRRSLQQALLIFWQSLPECFRSVVTHWWTSRLCHRYYHHHHHHHHQFPVVVGQVQVIVRDISAVEAILQKTMIVLGSVSPTTVNFNRQFSLHFNF